MTKLRCEPPDLAPTTVHIEAGCASATLPERIARRFAGRPVRTLADRTVLEERPALAADPCLAVDGGEDLKTFAGLERVLRWLAATGTDRTGVLVAIGGGSVGDLGGLAAALHLRGIELVMVPTTLLAMVDSSVGGKTAINLPEGKNLVGTLWPAAEVFVDPELVGTLPEAEWRSGLGEVLKVAIGLDAELFEACERDPDALLARRPDATAHAVERALRAKIAVVQADAQERGPRRLLNLGHTLGHALEAGSGFAIPHGVAVARGLHHALDVATARGELPRADADRARGLLRRFGFAADPLPPRALLRSYLARDKKIEAGTLHAVLPTAIGRSRVVAMDVDAFLHTD